MKWWDIWNNKTTQEDFSALKSREILAELLRLNGFDSGSGIFCIDDYLVFIQELIKKAKLDECESIFEVGCGSGAFLYGLWLKSEGGGDMLFKQIGGIDYASNLISYAKRIFIDFEHSFKVQEAKNLEEIPTFDAVCIFSVMHYFESLEYAYEVARKMFRKANKRVLFLDVLDVETKEEDIAYKKQIYGSAYQEMYGSLKHLYYPKDFFEKLSKEFGYFCKIEKQKIKNYNNSNFRFNVIAIKE